MPLPIPNDICKHKIVADFIAVQRTDNTKMLYKAALKNYFDFLGATDYKTIDIAVSAPPSSPAIINVKIGDTVKGKNLEVTVLSYEFTDSYTFSIEDMQFTQNAAEGKTFVIINVRFHQIGEDSQFVSPNDFWIIEHNNYKYDCDYRTYSLDGGLTMTTLYKNLNTEGKVLFEIPKDSTDLRVQYNFATFWETPQIAEWKIS